MTDHVMHMRYADTPVLSQYALCALAHGDNRGIDSDALLTGDPSRVTCTECLEGMSVPGQPPGTEMSKPYDMHIRLDGVPRPISTLGLDELRKALVEAHSVLFHCNRLATRIEVALDVDLLPAERIRGALQKLDVFTSRVYVPRDEEEDLRAESQEDGS